MGDGFNLMQEGAISNDIKNIMSEQLNEIRAMAMEIRKQNETQANSAKSVNPYIMNPYYTEHHARNIEQSMNMMRAQESIRNDMINSPLRKLTDFANQDGYFSLRYGDGMINGRGVTQKDIDLAAVQTQGRIVSGITDKVGGFFGFGANMAGGTAGAGFTSALMGVGALSIPAIGVGIATGALAEKVAREGFEEIQTYYDYKTMLTANSDRFIAPGENTDPLTSGFTKSEIKKASKFMTKLNSQFDIEDAEMAEFFKAASDHNLMKSATDLESFEKVMTKLTDMSKKYAKTMGKTMTEIANMMGELNRAGISTSGMSEIFMTMDQTSALMGMSTEQYTSYIANRTSGLAYGTSANSNNVAADQALQAGFAGSIMTTMSNIRSEDPNFKLANYVKNLGTEGFTSALSSVAGFGKDAVDMTLFRAAYDTKTKTVDANKVKQMVADMGSGKLTFTDVANMADKVKLEGEQYYEFTAGTRDFRAEYSMLSIEGAVSFALSAQGMSKQDFIAIGDTRQQVALLTQAGMTEEQAYAAVAALVSTSGNMAQSAESIRNEGRLTNVANRLSTSFWDRFSLKTEKEMRLLSGTKIDGPINYSKINSRTKSREAMKFGYLSFAANLGEDEVGRSAKSQLENIINTQVLDFGWQDDVGQSIGGIAAMLTKDTEASGALRVSIAQSAQTLGLTDVVDTIKNAKGGNMKNIKEIQKALQQIVQADADSFLSGDIKNTTSEMKEAVRINTEAQIEMAKTVSGLFADTNEQLKEAISELSGMSGRGSRTTFTGGHRTSNNRKGYD